MEYDLGRATKQEITALQVMLHRACLHSGMEVAEVAGHWNRRLILAMNQTDPVSNGKVQTDPVSNGKVQSDSEHAAVQ